MCDTLAHLTFTICCFVRLHKFSIIILIALSFQVDLSHHEKCEFLPFLSPSKVNLKNNKIVSLELFRTDIEDGQWQIDTEQKTTVKADYIISAFGSGLHDSKGKLLVRCTISM